MAAIMGIEVDDAIEQVRLGISDAQAELGARHLPFQLDSIELALKVVLTIGEEFKPKFKVPIFGWEIGGDMSASGSYAQTISVTLKPEPKPGQKNLLPTPNVRRVLAMALVEAAEILRDASGRGLTGDSASVSLELAFTAKGEVEVLIVSGSVEHGITSTLTVNLKAA